MFSAYVLYLVSFFALFLPSNKNCQALGQCIPMTTFLSEGYRHTFSSQLLPGGLHTVCSISTILPAVCKIMSDEIFLFFFLKNDYDCPFSTCIAPRRVFLMPIIGTDFGQWSISENPLLKDRRAAKATITT